MMSRSGSSHSEKDHGEGGNIFPSNGGSDRDITAAQAAEDGHVHNSFDTGGETDVGPAPDGGLEAWLVACASFCIFFCCLGFANSFGTLADYYLTHQLRNESSDRVAWIGSLAAFLQFFSGMIGGPLFDRYGTKV